VPELMAEADKIVYEICDYVFGLPVEQHLVGTNEQIQAVCDLHRELLLCFDGYFSGLRTKRYHLTEEIIARTKQYCNRTMAIMRHLGMSVTPKDHALEDHVIHLEAQLGYPYQAWL
jgi:hypothetical protein